MGGRSLLRIISRGTGYLFAQSVKDKTTRETTKKLWGIFTKFGLPEITRTDWASSFAIKLDTFCKSLIIKYTTISAYNSGSNWSGGHGVKSAKEYFPLLFWNFSELILLWNRTVLTNGFIWKTKKSWKKLNRTDHSMPNSQRKGMDLSISGLISDNR